MNTENEFDLSALSSFFDNDDEKNINWEDFFSLSDDEKFYAINNNQIIEKDKSEDLLWAKYI